MDPALGVNCNPAFLGPLDDDLTPVTGPAKVFAGEEKYLSARKLDARVKLCDEIAPILGRLLDQEETVLHVLPALHYPRFLDFFGFGMWWTLVLSRHPGPHRPPGDRGADARRPAAQEPGSAPIRGVR